MKLTNALLYTICAAEAPNPKTDALAAKGPAAIAEALEAELAKAEAAGDKEHAASIKKHWADYLSERRERIEDAEGGHLDTREAAAAGPDDRKARAGNVAAVEAALEQEMKQAEKYNDKEHEASLEKHLMDYLHMEHGLGRD